MMCGTTRRRSAVMIAASAAVRAPTAMPRVQGDDAGLGSSICLRPTLRDVRGWPKARWALRHSGQMSSSAWKAIQCDLRSVRVEGVRCPDAPTAALPLLPWWAALEGDSRVLWLWHHGGHGEGAVGAGGNAA